MDHMDKLIMKHTGLSPGDGDIYDEVRALVEEALHRAGTGVPMPSTPD